MRLKTTTLLIITTCCAQAGDLLGAKNAGDWLKADATERAAWALHAARALPNAKTPDTTLAGGIVACLNEALADEASNPALQMPLADITAACGLLVDRNHR